MEKLKKIWIIFPAFRSNFISYAVEVHVEVHKPESMLEVYSAFIALKPDSSTFPHAKTEIMNFTRIFLLIVHYLL